MKKNTILIFLSDNGGRGEHADNRPYRGHKGMLFEGGIRVPFFLTWPAGIREPKVFEKPIISLDIFPTLVAATEVQPEKDLRLDGVNLWPYLKDENQGAPHEILYWRSVGGYEYAVRKGKFKLYKIGLSLLLKDTVYYCDATQT